jgi:putative hydrolase of the HAD superfamily
MNPMIPTSIRAVVFDAVGTLIHPAIPAPRMYAEVAARRGIILSEDEIRSRFLAAFRAEELRDRANDWLTSEEREAERWRAIVSATLGNGDCFDELFEHYAKPEAWAVDADAAETFAGLRERGLILGLASNYDSRLDKVVEGHAELRSLRPHIVVSSQVGHRKPGRSFFAAVMDTVGLPAEAIAFVGDDVANDYEGAAAAGMAAILLDPKDRHLVCPARIASLRVLLG